MKWCKGFIVRKSCLIAGLVVFLSTLAAPAHAQMKDLAMAFGQYGLWLHYADADRWAQLNQQSPDIMAVGDVDGNKQSDLIVDFPGWGVWMWLNNSQWVQLTASNATHIITTDLDGNGTSVVLADFPGFGIWVWRYGTGWSQLNASSPSFMATGDLDGNGRADVLIDFQGYGVWVWMNNQSWTQLHPTDVTSMAVGDVDGNGKDDVLLDFPGAGTWVWCNNTSWFQLHSLAASHMVTADLDGNGRAAAIIDFAGYGLWVWRNGTGWSQLNPIDAEALTVADLDGNGRTDLVVDFGAPGLWGWWNNANWTQLHPQSPEGSVAGSFYSPSLSVGPGTYRVGAPPNLPAGRYYTDPAPGCYWERLSGLGDTLSQIIANNFIDYDAGQTIVDIRSTDYAFSTVGNCARWDTTPRRGLQANITPGMWLVGSQVTPGLYMSSVNAGCHWERLSNFDGTPSAIIANDSLDTPGVQYVQVSASDVGFQTNGDCGTWLRVPD